MDDEHQDDVEQAHAGDSLDRTRPGRDADGPDEPDQADPTSDGTPGEPAGVPADVTPDRGNTSGRGDAVAPELIERLELLAQRFSTEFFWSGPLAHSSDMEQYQRLMPDAGGADIPHSGVADGGRVCSPGPVGSIGDKAGMG